VGFLSAKGIAARERASAKIRILHLPDLAAVLRERLAQTFGQRYLAELNAVNQRLRDEIAQREQAEQKLHECEANLHRIIDISADAVAFSRFADSTLIDVSHGFERLGYRREGAIDHTWEQLGIWADPRRHEEFRRRLADDGSVRDMEMILRGKDGASIPVNISGTLIEINGEICSAMILRNAGELSAARPDDADTFRLAAPPAITQTPASDAAEAAIERDARRDHPALVRRALRILLVEDSPDNRLVLRTYLRKLPCEIDEADNGEIAVNRFVGGSYDVVLMDLHMPVMDGITATHKIRELEQRSHAHCWIIALTASAFDDELRRMREAGADLELRKPINKAALLDAIETLTGIRLDEPHATPSTPGD
jgi:PAS domain S-box-containing protein